MASDVGCGIDVFFGGGTYDFAKQANAGRFVPSNLPAMHPDWFSDSVIPLKYDGEEYRDKENRWFGCVLSCFGIIYNRDALHRLGLETPPKQWADLDSFRYFGEVALCDPTKSGSIAEAFENVIQQQMQRKLREVSSGNPTSDSKTVEAQAIREGWTNGLRLLQLVGANARYFTDTSQKPPIDVAAGNCAVGMCIDFYGRTQVESAALRNTTGRLGYVAPVGGTVYSVDPIGLLRGAPHKEVATAFMEYVLSMDGQKLWNFKVGTPGGTSRYALRRIPVRRDFYSHPEWNGYRSDPDAQPYNEEDQLVYHEAWTGALFREMAFIIRVMCQDTHDELADAWRTLNLPSVTEENRKAALAVLQDMSAVSYERSGHQIKQALGAKDKADEIRFANELAATFRRQYKKAKEIALGNAR
jgi:ABC-type Fe3+ transport system substrate-binding protein